MLLISDSPLDGMGLLLRVERAAMPWTRYLSGSGRLPGVARAAAPHRSTGDRNGISGRRTRPSWRSWP